MKLRELPSYKFLLEDTLYSFSLAFAFCSKKP